MCVDSSCCFVFFWCEQTGNFSLLQVTSTPSQTHFKSCVTDCMQICTCCSKSKSTIRTNCRFNKDSGCQVQTEICKRECEQPLCLSECVSAGMHKAHCVLMEPVQSCTDDKIHKKQSESILLLLPWRWPSACTCV